MLSTDGADHSRHRDPFALAFSGRRAQALANEIDEIAGRLARHLASGPTDLLQSYAGPLATEVILVALDLPELDVGQVREWYGAIVDAVQDASRIDEDVEAHEAFAALKRAVLGGGSTVVDSARRHLTDDEVASNVAVIMFGAIETGEGAITNAFRHVLLNPATSASASTEAIVEESLRLEPAATVVHRYATTDIELFGAAIETGDFVSVSLAGANRDPAVFDEPDTFDPHRSGPRPHLTFATGPHLCLGLHVARIEARSALDAAPPLELLGAPPEPRGLIFRKPPELRVRPSAEVVAEQGLGGDAEGTVEISER